MTAAIVNITFDCADPYALAGFWARVTGLPLDTEARPGDDEVCLVPPPGRPGFLFIRVPEGKTAKNRIHLDLTQDTTRDAEVERIVALGGVIVQDHRRPDGSGWVYLGDPEGNEFCVELNTAERAALSR
ncbi:VOC family protein [Actinocrinis puniceicyclus]|uniref:VOC family protein n=1 Tax=Actinocrinis puniceicyclus TaxID=977794 RepID=A0A8J7WMW3_9ACTN|nr:VOC family protein [Actinocrinis puniceicyclus]MBS2965306.1 VOC family protein [Actinocrinis puniceicyclus]